MRNIVTVTLVATLVALAADPAFAQWGGGVDPGFRQGLSTTLSWVYVIAVFAALFAFVVACVGLFVMRNMMIFVGGVAGVIVGGVLISQAPTIVQALTNLQVAL